MNLLNVLTEKDSPLKDSLLLSMCPGKLKTDISQRMKSTSSERNWTEKGDKYGYDFGFWDNCSRGLTIVSCYGWI